MKVILTKIGILLLSLAVVGLYSPVSFSATYLSRWGAKIEGSCSEEQQTFIESILSHVVSGARACRRVLPIPEMGKTVSALIDLTITCKKGLSATALADQKDHKIVLGYDRGILGDFFAMAEANATETLFHELLHLTASNNRAWHNETEGHNIFLDRVYLTSTLCFPNGWNMNGLLHGNDVREAGLFKTCQRAYGEVESLPARSEAFVASPIPTIQRDVICHRAEEIRDAALAFDGITSPLFSLRNAEYFTKTTLSLEGFDFDSFGEMLRQPVLSIPGLRKLIGIISNPDVAECKSAQPELQKICADWQESAGKLNSAIDDMLALDPSLAALFLSPK